MEDPNRAKLRTDNVEPSATKSRTDNEAPNLHLPNTENWEPIRANLLKDIDEPR
jgi:hypothetical protein